MSLKCHYVPSKPRRISLQRVFIAQNNSSTRQSTCHFQNILDNSKSMGFTYDFYANRWRMCSISYYFRNRHCEADVLEMSLCAEQTTSYFPGVQGTLVAWSVFLIATLILLNTIIHMKKLQHIRDIPSHCFSRHPRKLMKDAVFKEFCL
jgi:hypothetical protein